MRRGGRRGGKEGEREEKGGRRERERGGEIIRHSVRDEHTAVCKNPFNTRREISGDCRGGQPL